MKISSGSQVLDSLLEGGYSTGMLNTIYGPAASGKTTCCFLATISCHKQGKKTIFIDTENGFNVERIKQLTPDYKRVLESVILLKVDSFIQQTRKFEFLAKMFPNARIGLVIVDTIGAQYRAARKDDIRSVNQELADQINVLRQIYKKTNTAVLITDQVYANLDKENSVGMVGGEVVKNQSRTIIQLQCGHKNKRNAILEKSEDLEVPREVNFKIIQEGFIPL